MEADTRARVRKREVPAERISPRCGVYFCSQKSNTKHCGGWSPGLKFYLRHLTPERGSKITRGTYPPLSGPQSWRAWMAAPGELSSFVQESGGLQCSSLSA